MSRSNVGFYYVYVLTLEYVRPHIPIYMSSYSYVCNFYIGVRVLLLDELKASYTSSFSPHVLEA